MSRLSEALAVLLGRPLDPTYGHRSPVHTHPDAWRCACCGGSMISGPAGKPYVHLCGRDQVRSGGRRVRYVGVRAHLSRVWASVWGNRPRVESRPPAHGRRLSVVLSPGEVRVPEKMERRYGREVLEKINGSGSMAHVEMREDGPWQLRDFRTGEPIKPRPLDGGLGAGRIERCPSCGQMESYGLSEWPILMTQGGYTPCGHRRRTSP